MDHGEGREPFVMASVRLFLWVFVKPFCGVLDCVYVRDCTWAIFRGICGLNREFWRRRSKVKIA